VNLLNTGLENCSNFNVLGSVPSVILYAALCSGLFSVLFLYHTPLIYFRLILGTLILIVKGEGQNASNREDWKSIIKKAKILRGSCSQGISIVKFMECDYSRDFDW
jgi:hypothetical protein